MSNPIVKGGKRRGSRKGRGKGKGSKRQNQNQNQNQNQQGGACGNSSSVAAAYGGSVPMMPVQQGGELQSSNYNANAGNTLVKGGSSLLPTMGGNAVIIKGGNVSDILPKIGGNGLFKGGNVVPTPGMPVMPTTGGNVLNELAVPAVLLYANNTFGKKKNYTGRKFRRSGKKSRRARR